MAKVKSDAMTPAKPSLWEKSWHHCKSKKAIRLLQAIGWLILKYSYTHLLNYFTSTIFFTSENNAVCSR